MEGHCSGATQGKWGRAEAKEAAVQGVEVGAPLGQPVEGCNESRNAFKGVMLCITHQFVGSKPDVPHCIVAVCQDTRRCLHVLQWRRSSRFVVGEDEVKLIR